MLRRIAGPSLAIIISLAIALAVFGLRVANPMDTSWITGDGVTMQFGWDQYRNDPNHFYPLQSDRFSWPMTMSVAMFDNVPIVAFFMKMLAPILPEPFQYFGPIFFLGIALQTALGWMLLREVTRERSGMAYQLCLFIGAIFFGTAPILYVRFFMMHIPLVMQWTLIANLLIYARSPRIGFGKTLRDYGVLLFIIGSINPYTLVMNLIIYAGYMLKLLSDRTMGWKRFGLCMLPVAAGGLAMIIFGFFNPFGDPVIPGPGYAFFSANFNALYNPLTDFLGSTILPELPVSSAGQYEGYGYMGLGALLLVLGSLIYARMKREGGNGLFAPLIGAMMVAFLLALSRRYSVGPFTIDLPVPQKIEDILSIFRSSGRFIWVVVYGLLFMGIASLIRLVKPERAAIFMMAAAVIQVQDLGEPLKGLRMKMDRNQIDRFQSPSYANLGKAHDQILVVPPWQCLFWKKTFTDNDHFEYSHMWFTKFSNLAMESKLPINSFYAGRTPVAQANYHCEEFPAKLEAKPANKRTAYILSMHMFQLHGAHFSKTHQCDFADDLFICRGDGPAGMTERAKRALPLIPTAKHYHIEVK